MAFVNRFRIIIALAWSAGFIACTSWTTQIPLSSTDSERYTHAVELERTGDTEGAFLEYITIPGAEHSAAALARTEPDTYLALLQSTNAPAPIVQLLEGDLLLARGDREEALACYRAVAANIASDCETGWSENRMPWNYYPVEPPSPEKRLLKPFAIGPGSHNDNWLIRRFIGLDAMDDAEREFERIWQLHRHDTRPHIVRALTRTPGSKGQLDPQPCLIGTTSYDGPALRFALDYAYFLKRCNQQKASLAILLAPLLSMDLDRAPGAGREMVRLTEEEAKTYPPKARGDHSPFFRYHPTSAGVTREEYIRLAFGEFRNAKKENELVAALLGQIDSGSNRARLVLARARMHQHDIEGSLALELAYIRHGGFDHASATYRRGVVYETHRQLDKAAEEFEALLNMKPAGGANLPFEKIPQEVQQALFAPEWQCRLPAWNRLLNTDVIPRLQRIYVAERKTDDGLDLSLKRFDLFPGSRVDLKLIDETADRFAAAGKEEAFVAWAEHLAEKEENPTARANLYWAINDPRRTLNALTKVDTPKKVSPWISLFEKDAPALLPELLELSLAFEPGNTAIQLKALDLHPDPLGPDAVKELELLLAPDAQPLFHPGKGRYIRTRFRNYYDLAYRLARLYEQENRIDDLLKLGERVAFGTKPFQSLENIDRYSYDFRQGSGSEGDVDSILSLLIHHADTATMKRLENAWSTLPDFPSKRQLERKQHADFGSSGAPAIPWANLPPGVKALASSENVLSLAADEHHVYSGHPWGIAVYDYDGHPVIRVALGAAAITLETCGGKVWAGTPQGLWRIEPKTWKVALLPMHQDIPKQNRDPGSADFLNGISSLKRDGDALWIGTRRDIRRLDLTNGVLRIFSQRELGVNHHNDWDRILIEQKYVWFDGYDSCLRYDRATRTWSKLQYNKKTVHLIGDVQGELFGHVHLGEPLRNRPCLINRQTLQITPILIQGDLTRDQRCINGPFNYFGTYRRKPVFGPKYPEFTYNSKSKKLTRIGNPWIRKNDPIESPIPSGLRSGTPKGSTDGSWSCDDDVTHQHTVFGIPFHASNWTLLNLPSGTRVLGGAHADSPRYKYPNEDRPYSSYRDRQRDIYSGGLYFIPPNSKPIRVSAAEAANAMPSDLIYTVVPAGNGRQYWLCGDSGVTLLSPDLNVLENIQRADGTPASRVTHAITSSNKTFFSLSTGGMMTFSEKSNIFIPVTPIEATSSPFYAGLKKALAGASKQSRFDPDEIIREPLLGGYIVSTSRVNNATLVCGTRGLLIYEGTALSKTVPDQLEVEIQRDKVHRLVAEAKALNVEQDISPERFQELLKHDNPFVRAEALGSASFSKAVLQSREFATWIHPCLSDAEARVRCTAVYALTRCKQNDLVIPVLKELLSSPDKRLRAVATIYLCRRGILPKIKYLREILNEGNSYGNHPFRAASTIGVLASRQYLIEAVAPLATPEVFSLLLELHTPSIENYDFKAKVYTPLGTSLLRHPEAANILLTAYDDNNTVSRRNFSMHVFQQAGTNMLTTLHEALKSNDRVVRSNAARACGAIGDPSSIQPLIRAWDLDSGLSRASIVWALGELHAQEATPLLEQAYIDARLEEKRVRRAGYRTGQRVAALSAQYDELINLDSVNAEWDELKAAAAPKAIEPENDEELISDRHVLRALAKMDPAATQNFYRTLTADDNPFGRIEAAERLALAPDRQENIAILRPMLADDSDAVRMAAAASLLILSERAAEPFFLNWLSDTEQWTRLRALKQLTRVESPEALAFAAESLKKCAAIPAAGMQDESEVNYANNLLDRLNASLP